MAIDLSIIGDAIAGIDVIPVIFLFAALVALLSILVTRDPRKARIVSFPIAFQLYLAAPVFWGTRSVPVVIITFFLCALSVLNVNTLRQGLFSVWKTGRERAAARSVIRREMNIKGARKEYTEKLLKQAEKAQRKQAERDMDDRLRREQRDARRGIQAENVWVQAGKTVKDTGATPFITMKKATDNVPFITTGQRLKNRKFDFAKGMK